MGADLRRRSAWRVVAPLFVFAVVLAVALVVRASTGESGAAALVLSGGLGLLAIWAVLDGLARASGRATYLGTGRGIDRVIGVMQVGASAGVAVAMLPNAVALLEGVGSLIR